ncbi:MAG: ribosomal protein [Myxococcales bacterium]|nr:ribosomal protein [Myxococcales bacterium]
MNPEFDHEKLDVYRLSIEFLAWVGTLIDDRLKGTRLSVIKHLDESSTSVALNIAEGNGKRSLLDRARFLDIARGSALESAACLDVLIARRKVESVDVRMGKTSLVRIVSMLTKLIETLLVRSASTSTSTSTSTHARTNES